MPIPVQCPGCSAKLNAPDAAAGKKVKCPKCGAAITIPAPAPAFEVVEEPEAPAEPPPAKQPVRAETEPEVAPPKRAKRTEDDRDEEADEDAPRKRKRQDEDDDTEDAPRKKKRRDKDEDDEAEESPKKRRGSEAETEDDDRPRKKKRRDEDDGDEDRPRKKKRRDDDETEGSGSKKKWLFIGGGAALLLVGIVLAIVLSQSGSSGDKTENKDNKDGTPVADDLKVISPRTTIATKFPGKEAYHRDISYLALSADGSTVVATNNAYDENRQSQAWSVRGEAKKLDGYENDILMLSSDGTLLSKAKKGKFGSTGKPEIVDVATGAASTRPFLTVEKNSMRTATGRYNWNSSFDSRKQGALKIFHYEEPSGKALGPYDGGDEDRVQFAGPVKDGAELVYGLPRTGKVRVFDFAAKAVTKEFALANPREFRGPSGTSPDFNCFRVSSDGKWIATKRVTLARDPDPTEVFDMTGAVVATIPPRAFSDMYGTFLINRDVYVGPGGFGATGMKSDSKELLAYDINKKQFVAVFRGGHKVYVNQIALSADGKVMATAGTGGEVCIWDLTQLP